MQMSICVFVSTGVAPEKASVGLRFGSLDSFPFLHAAVNSPVSGRSPSPSPLPPFPSSSEAALLLSSALAASSAQATKSYSSPSPVGLPPSTLLASPSSPRVVAPASGSSQVLSSTSCPQTASGVYHPGPPSVVVTPPASPHQADGLQVPGPLVEIPSEFLRSAGSASDAHDSFPIHSNPPIPSLSPGTYVLSFFPVAVVVFMYLHQASERETEVSFLWPQAV